MLLGRAKDEHFSCFLSSFQLGLKWSWVKKSHVEGKWSCEFDKQLFFFQLDISHVIYLQLKNFGSYVDHLDLQLFPVKIGKEQKWYFVTKIVLTYREKKIFLWSRKTFEIRGWKLRICKNFEITSTIYSNSERTKQFLVTECFFNLFLEVSQI